jgi:hypothetical protein
VNLLSPTVTAVIQWMANKLGIVFFFCHNRIYYKNYTSWCDLRCMKLFLNRRYTYSLTK